ncbi:MAG TPA: type VI secretion system baseplate subunit TssK [Polyangiaceae bacterium]|jgi:type VI secretion system protein ImpJ
MLTKPHWTHGLDLGHPHFELLDRYHEELVDHRLAALFEHAWGIHEIRWDTRAIGAGQVALRKLDAILPDGTPVACDAAQGIPGPAIAIGDLAPGAAIQVHLGVRQVRAGSNVDTEGSKDPRRYRRETVLMPDLTGGSEPSHVEGLRPNLHLLLDGEPRQDFVTLPCARVIRTAAGQLAYDETFVPPVLSVNASPYLRGELRRALDALMARQGIASRPSAQDATDVVRRWLGSIIGSFVPRVGDLTHQRFVHPHTAYTVLAELVGALAPFTSAGTIQIPAFAFDRLGPVFARLFSDLAIALDAVGAENYRRLQLVRRDPTTLFVDLKEPAIFRQDFLLSVSGTDVDDLRIRVPQLCKLGAWPQMPEILKSATTGVPLRHEPRPPGALPGGTGTLYFRLQKSDAFELVVKHGQMGIFHGSGLPITDMALFAVDPGAA